MIIGLTGFMGSGKGTVAKHLVQKYGFEQLSFAQYLKDIVAILFDWPRNLLEGDSPESRVWREKPDFFWTRELNWQEPLTPRKVLQYLGTNVFRNHLHCDFWVKRLKKDLVEKINKNKSIVISDCRFANEFILLRQFNAKIWSIQKTQLPPWFKKVELLLSQSNSLNQEQIAVLENITGMHISELAWLCQKPDHTIYNNGDLSLLYEQIDQLIVSNPVNQTFDL